MASMSIQRSGFVVWEWFAGQLMAGSRFLGLGAVSVKPICTLSSIVADRQTGRGIWKRDCEKALRVVQA